MFLTNKLLVLVGTKKLNKKKEIKTLPKVKDINNIYHKHFGISKTYNQNNTNFEPSMRKILFSKDVFL